jgi:hypothetical protein
VTDEQIKRAARLIDEVARLRDILEAKDRKLVIAQQFDKNSRGAQDYGQQCFPVEELSAVDARALAQPILDGKMAELEALRDSD